MDYLKICKETKNSLSIILKSFCQKTIPYKDDTPNQLAASKTDLLGFVSGYFGFI